MGSRQRVLRRRARLAWMLGGSLMIGSVVVVVLVWTFPFNLPGAFLLSPALFSSSLILFAFGIGGAGSITARRPLGTLALTALAVWEVASASAASLLPSAFGAPTESFFAAAVLAGLIDAAVRCALGVIAVVQIARAGVLPRPWNWAPAWALAAVAAAWLVQTVLGALPASSAMPAIGQGWLEGLARGCATTFLGALAIFLAKRPLTPHVDGNKPTA